MEIILTALLSNPVLFGLALLINVLVSIFKDVAEGISKGKGEDPTTGIPAILFKNLLIVLIIALSYTGTFWLCKAGYVVAIEDSKFTTSVVVAVISIIFYNIGIKDLMEWIKDKLNIKKKDTPTDTNNNGGNG